MRTVRQKSVGLSTDIQFGSEEHALLHKIVEDKLHEKVEKAEKKAAGLELRQQRMECELKKCKTLNAELKDQLAVTKQELRLLSNDPALATIEEQLDVQEAVAQQIKRRRSRSAPNAEPITLKE